MTEEFLDFRISQINDLVIPAEYKVSVDFRRERVCESGYMDETDTWVCIKYSADERTGRITVTNQGAPGRFTTTIEGRLYLSGVDHGALPFWGAWNPTQWTDYFEAGQTRTYDIGYMVPITGMAFDSRFFIRVFAPDGRLIAYQEFIQPL